MRKLRLKDCKWFAKYLTVNKIFSPWFYVSRNIQHYLQSISSIFTSPFVKQGLFHDNLMQYLLAISVENIIFLSLHNYRFEHYENNQDKYHKNWSFKRNKGKIEGNAMLCLPPAANQQKQSLWGSKTTPNGGLN